MFFHGIGKNAAEGGNTLFRRDVAAELRTVGAGVKFPPADTVAGVSGKQVHIFDTGSGIADDIGGFGVEFKDLRLIDTGRKIGDLAASGIVAAGAAPFRMVLKSLFRQKLRFSAQE